MPFWQPKKHYNWAECEPSGNNKLDGTNIWPKFTFFVLLMMIFSYNRGMNWNWTEIKDTKWKSIAFSHSTVCVFQSVFCSSMNGHLYISLWLSGQERNFLPSLKHSHSCSWSGSWSSLKLDNHMTRDFFNNEYVPQWLWVWSLTGAGDGESMRDTKNLLRSYNRQVDSRFMSLNLLIWYILKNIEVRMQCCPVYDYQHHIKFLS